MAHTKLTIDGEDKPSVTQIVNVLDKPYLYRWYGMNGWTACEKLKEEKREQGIAFHESVEAALKFKFGFTKEEPNWDEAVEVVMRWADRVGFKPIAFEEHVVSEVDGYNGTFDCAGMIGDDLILVDWKRTSQISDTYVIQMAGYYRAYLLQAGKAFKEARVIRPYELKNPAKKDEVKQTAGGWKYSFAGMKFFVEERRYTNLDRYMKIFLHCREIWDFVNKKGPWKQDDSVLQLDRRREDVPAPGV